MAKPPTVSERATKHHPGEGFETLCHVRASPGVFILQGGWDRMKYEQLTREGVKQAIARIAAECSGNDEIRTRIGLELGYHGTMIFTQESASPSRAGQDALKMARLMDKPVRKDDVWVCIRMEGPDGEELVL